MERVSEVNGTITMMIAYGELIHFHREKDFVNKTTGQYIDDDFDMFASIDTVKLVELLEPELFERLVVVVVVNENLNVTSA